MSLFRRVANLFSRSKVNGEIDDELRSHIEMRTADNVARGMSPSQARRDALVRFGNPTATRERAAGMDTALLLEGIRMDVRFACRQLARNTGFACTAILTLALGMCASVSIFSFVDAALIKPLPYADPSRLVSVFESTPSGPRFHLSYPDYLDWKRLNRVFTSLDAYDDNTYLLSTPSGVQEAEGATVGAGFFHTLGVVPILGRDFQRLPRGHHSILRRGVIGTIRRISVGIHMKVYPHRDIGFGWSALYCGIFCKI
jgi:macrolide transport system ATP-binding/permease protein